MRSYKFFLAITVLVSCLLNSETSVGQTAPAISYVTPQPYTKDIAISSLAPINTGGVATASGYNSFSTFIPSISAYSVSTDASGNVYTANYSNHTIYKYNSSGVGGSINTNSTSQPIATLIDGLGNLFVSDYTTKSVYKFNSSGTLLSTTTGFNQPYGLACDAANNIYVADLGAEKIVKITANTTTKTNLSITGLIDPYGIAISGNNIFVSQYTANNIIKITNGVTGSTTKSPFASGFNGPRNLNADASGNIYVADYDNNAIKKITSGSAVSVFLSGLDQPRDLSFDSSGNLYVANSGSSSIVKSTPVAYAISPALPAGLSFDNTTGTISGTPTTITAAAAYTVTAYNASGSSSAIVTLSVLPTPPDISYDTPQAFANGVDIGTVAPTNAGGDVPATIYGTVSTFAGAGAGSTDATGTSAKFNKPQGIAIDGSGTMYVADATNNAIRKITPGGVVTTITSSLSTPYDVAIDPTGTYLYVANYGDNTIKRVTIIGGAIAPVAGSSSGNSGTSDGTGTFARFNKPSAIVYNKVDGYLYVCDYTIGLIRKVSTAGNVTTLTATGFSGPSAIVADAAGNLYVADKGNNNIKRVTLAGAVSVFAGSLNGTSGSTDAATTLARFNAPMGITIDASGNFYVDDTGTGLVRMITPAGVVSTVVSASADIDGRGLAFDPSTGNIFLADYNNNKIKKILGTGYSISPSLPSGLTFNKSTGEITGTPDGTSTAKNYIVTAFNLGGSSATTINIGVGKVYNWDGSTSTNWATASNWNPATVPSDNDRAQIGVKSNINFDNLPTVTGTANVGSIVFGSRGGAAAVLTVSGTLNVTSDITYQSDADSKSGYTALLKGSGTVNTTDLEVTANTSINNSNYTQTLATSVSNLNLSGSISLTSNFFSSTKTAKAALNITGGTVTTAGIETVNDANAASTSTVTVSNGATLNFTDPEALSGLSSAGVNTLTLNTGSTLGYTGLNAQTVYTSSTIDGLSGGGISYKNIAFGGTGIKTALSGNLNISGDFTNTLANDASNYLNVSAVPVLFNGTTQALAGGTGTGTALYNTTFSGGGTKTKTGKFSIASSSILTMSSNTTLVANGALTLKSDASGSATIPAMPTGASITGNVNVERFVTGNNNINYRGYRLMSSPVHSTTTPGSFGNLNYLAANTIITGAISTYGSIGGNPTIYLYNETLPVNNSSFVSGNFVGVTDIRTDVLGTISGSTSSTTKLPSGNGFFLYFRGDKTTNAAHKTVAPFATADDVTFTATGVLNQGNIPVNNWFGSNLSNANVSAAAKGFNLVGNPYPSTIDWDKYTDGDNDNGTSTTSAIPHKGISKIIYMYNPSTRGYTVYIAGTHGIATNNIHNANLISAGEGFFVKATPGAVNPTLSFTEAAKTSTQASGTNLLLSTEPVATAPVLQYLRIQVLKDKLNTDDALIFFKKDAKTEYVESEDASYLKGNTIVNISTQSSDKVALAINQTALPKTTQTKIDLNVTVTSNGIYQLNIPEMKNIPQLYDVWLMDALKKDSLDIKHNPTYNFNAVTADAATFSKRFSLVIRQNPAYAYRLLDFNGALTTAGTVQLNWKTENEETYTYFTVERSTNGGKTFDILGSEKAVSQNTYSLLDKTPVVGENLYRLKQEDINGVVTYSPVVRIMYSLSNNTPIVASNVSVYPNPASSTLNLAITKKTTGTANYTISVTSATGRVVKTIVASQPDWQGDVSSFLPGTYFVQVINANDKSLVGKTTFIKL